MGIISVISVLLLVFISGYFMDKQDQKRKNTLILGTADGIIDDIPDKWFEQSKIAEEIIFNFCDKKITQIYKTRNKSFPYICRVKDKHKLVELGSSAYQKIYKKYKAEKNSQYKLYEDSDYKPVIRPIMDINDPSSLEFRTY